jgi:hypothetical protein
MDFWTAAFLFGAGILAHKLGSYLFLYSKRILFFNSTAFAGLRIFKFVSDSIEEINKIKYTDMEKQEIDKDRIEEEKEQDESVLNFWRSIAIVGIKEMLPSNMRSMLRFNTWEEAMRLLTKRDIQQGK